MKRLKITFNAPVTLSFAFISLAVLGLNILTRGGSNKMLFMTYHSSLLSPLTYLRFFTHVLGHSGWEHYAGNMMYILLLGPMLEEKYGSKRISTAILITAVVTGVINYIFFPGTALCGASGVVFAFILMTSFTGFHDGEIPLSFLLIAVIFLGQQVVEGIFVRDDVSNLSHILGGITGAVIGYNVNKKS